MEKIDSQYYENLYQLADEEAEWLKSMKEDKKKESSELYGLLKYLLIVLEGQLDKADDADDVADIITLSDRINSTMVTIMKLNNN